MPDQEPILDRQSLQNQRTRLFQVHETPPAFAATQQFVAALKEYVRTEFRATDRSTIWDDPSLGVHLYAFDESQGELVRMWHESFHNDPFPKRIVYGRDFIGTAFRSWYPCSYNGAAAAGQPFPSLDRVSEKRVKHLFACPLWHVEWTDQPPGAPIGQDPIDIAPVGVVAVVSEIADGGLGYILRHEDAFRELHRRIATLWRQCQVAAGWIAPPAT